MSFHPLHAFEYRDHLVVFDRDELALRLFPAPADVGEAVAPAGESCAAESSFEATDWTCEALSRETIVRQTPAKASPATGPALGRLTLTVSNLCNMKCSYCYADAGTYYNTHGLLMSRETALNAVTWAATAFSSIQHVNFFGGEPTLNRNIIELVCEYVAFLHDRGVLTNLPTFGITTNGYRLDERMFEILTGYNFTVTLSLDGPQSVHDKTRFSKSGRGTYDAVVSNIRTFMEKDIPIEFECTYSTEHIRQNIDLVYLMDFFYDMFQCRTLHAPVVSAAPGTPHFIPLDTCLSLQADAIRYSVRNLAAGIAKSISTATRMLQSLAHKSPIRNYCPAGRSSLTVNADGNVYACFMLMKGTAFSYGNVNGWAENSAASGSLSLTPGGTNEVCQQCRSGSDDGPRLVQDLIADADKQRHPACVKCWAEPLCHGCLAEDLARRAGPWVRSEAPGDSEFCDYKRAIADIFLHSVAEAYVSSKGSPVIARDTGGVARGTTPPR